MNDVIENCSIKGSIHLDEQDIYGPDIDPVELRARVGMVFQKANPFPNLFLTTLPMAQEFMAWLVMTAS